ncbi:MAG: hypothetical protein K5778_01730 [Bacteroidaceae bacterium]|nr:hypothetical protein [Bacteroidaceae bacterium]
MNAKDERLQDPSNWTAAELFAQCLGKVYRSTPCPGFDEVTYKTTADLVVEFEPMCSVELLDAARVIQEGGYEVAEMSGSVYWKMWRRTQDEL